MSTFPHIRLRRLRQTPAIRRLVRQTNLAPTDLIQPLFIHHQDDAKIAINSMPGFFQLGLNQLRNEILELKEFGVGAVLLFGIPAVKDDLGSDSCDPTGCVQRAIAEIKRIDPDMLVITDSCFCEYTSHGHCGIVSDKQGQLDLDNDATLELLAKQVVVQAQAGADMVAPSGSVDGMVAAIRQALDAANFQHIPIMSYSAKFASALYGPFREGLNVGLQFGDRRSYQMDPANSDEALRENELDISEGADILMVKPALFYLDVIHRIKQANPGVPLAAYMVSGEYAMIKAAGQQGWLDETQVMLEALLSIRRAGADLIITYEAKQIANYLNS